MQRPHLIDWRREGIEGLSPNNQLLRMLIQIKPEGDGSRLRQTYFWGPRPLLAQVLARADLLGGMYRMKSLAETGKPSETAHWVINAGVAVVTGFLSLLAFALLIGWPLSLLLIAALAFHEFGHLLAYKLIGQPWGRLMFLPFLAPSPCRACHSTRRPRQCSQPSWDRASASFRRPFSPAWR